MAGRACERDIDDWSKMKYALRRCRRRLGRVLQKILRALDRDREEHGVSIANVATRWTLDYPAVAAAIVGAASASDEHANDNLAIFSFALDDEDHARSMRRWPPRPLSPATAATNIAEPPFLTASGDLSHHLDSCREPL